MTTRPRKPAPNTPGPGKLPLPELEDLKRRGEKIAMVTAYDAPSGRGGRRWQRAVATER